MVQNQEWWKTALQVFGAFGGAGLVAWIAKWFWSLGRRTENAERNIKVLSGALQNLLQLVQQNRNFNKDAAQVIANTLTLHIEAEGNPITPEEARKLNEYIQWSREGRQFTVAQAQDFHQLTEKYRNDPKVLEKTPADELGTLFVLAGLIFAMYALAGAEKSKK